MIYADHNATSPLLPEVKEYLKNRMNENAVYGNPSSIHSLGKKVGSALERSRAICAKLVGANADQLFFNSGSSEGIAQIFQSILSQTTKKTIITSDQEHAAVEYACQYYQKNGYTIKKVDTFASGLIDINHFKKLIDDDVAMITIIAANNETGVIQPYEEIGTIAQNNSIPFFTDTTQLVGKCAFDFQALPIDYAVVSGHKLGSMTGIGFILAKEPTKLKPMIFGGYQEMSKRPGTQHYLGIETLAVALNQSIENLKHKNELEKARDNFEAKLKNQFKEIVIFGEETKRLEGTSLLGFRGIHGQAAQLELESFNIFVTTSSACSDNEPETSRVLKSMGIGDDAGRAAIRISLKNGQDPSDYDVIYEKLAYIFKKLSKIKYD